MVAAGVMARDVYAPTLLAARQRALLEVAPFAGTSAACFESAKPPGRYDRRLVA